MDIREIFLKYEKSDTFSAGPLGDGHINDTFLVKTENGKYVMQRIRSMTDAAGCLYNYELYSKVCEDSDWKYPVWLKNNEGKYFYTDRTGSSWRIYRYIDGEILSVPLEEDKLFSYGQGLARMHGIFSRIEGEPKAIYPHLHDLKYYYEKYLKTIQNEEKHREDRDPFVEEIIARRAEAMLAVKPGRCSVIHGDAKITNILFKDGRVIGFIDFDTVMKGSLLEDVADCIRSCCIEKGILNKKKAQKFVQGYLSEDSCDSLAGDMSRLPEVLDKICFELGLRYYTDAITKENIFKEKYPGYRMDRARSLFSIER